MEIREQLQQGDVCIERVDLFDDPTEAALRRGLATIGNPEGFSKIDNFPVREGSATGHTHRLVANKDFYARRGWRRGGLLFVFVPDGVSCDLVHEEHKTITLTPGKYVFSNVQEYDIVSGRNRAVVD